MPSPKFKVKKRLLMRTGESTCVNTCFLLKFIPLCFIYLYLLFGNLSKFTIDLPKALPFARLKSLSCPKGPNSAYSIVLDAGSTGSRIHIYRFHKCKATPVLEDEIFHAIKPGLSSFENEPKESVNSLSGLMKLAMENVPAQLHSKTKIVLKATAGLRLLKEGSGQVILQHVEQYLKTFPFILTENAVEIMDGKDEGVFAWITVNYLLDNLNKNNKVGIV
jgi:Golgi nucleoside diphosphatase